jgi:hypothetical protein
VTANVHDEPAAWERIKDMLRKLTSLATSDETASYDATALIVVDWSGGEVIIDESDVPEDLSPDRFFDVMLRRLFARSPVADHMAARELPGLNQSSQHRPVVSGPYRAQPGARG